jgi:hypothetical protein
VPGNTWKISGVVPFTLHSVTYAVLLINLISEFWPWHCPTFYLTEFAILSVTRSFLCRFIGKSGIISTVVQTLSHAENPLLAAAYINVLLQFSYHADNAKQMVESTSLLSLLPRVMNTCKASLRSTLVPLVLDLLWNLLERMPTPRCLPNKVLYMT